MPFNIDIPRSNNTNLAITIDAGQALFVLGANGTGKSSLMHRFYIQNSATSRRITAHRQNWFESNALSITAAARRDTENNMRNTDTNHEARWRDHYSGQRANMAIYDLINAENIDNRAIAQAVRAQNVGLTEELRKKDAPIATINELLRLSNLPITISVSDEEQVFAQRAGGSPYSVTELSDGERNALLIASNVLTAKAATLFLIDEPERHLHHSIVSPLLTLLFEKRPDCAFIISTHEVMLPIDNPESRTLLVRDCAYTNASISSWDVDIVSSDAEIDDDLKKDIFGERRKILFVEGAEHSPDKPLYSLIFPGISIVAKSSYHDVVQAVAGIRGAQGFAWVNAFGIIDNDGRAQAEIDRLRGRSVYALPVWSVESIYYHPEIQRRIAERHPATTGGPEQIPQNDNNPLETARTAALAAITPHIQRLSVRAVERKLREQIFQNLPRQPDIAAGTPINITIDVAAIVREEQRLLQEAVTNGDLSTIISKYPVRETPALTEIAARLGFQDRSAYEEAVRKLLIENPEALADVRAFFGTLEEDMNPEPVTAPQEDNGQAETAA